MENVEEKNLKKNQLLTKEQSMICVSELLETWDMDDLIPIFLANEIQMHHLPYMCSEFIGIMMKDFQVSRMIDLKIKIVSIILYFINH